ncbi:MAG TPA: putative Se/S carrier-like protein [Candidatus Elarobacter sp.]|nr:putative Se/S carrier-like protein [Candidatus Elarobacter sp.]
MGDVILLFDSNAGTMVATKALRDHGLPARMIPTPPGVQSRANLCLSIARTTEAAVLAALGGAKVAVASVVR